MTSNRPPKDEAGDAPPGAAKSRDSARRNDPPWAALPWHAGQWERCLRMEETGRLSHAFLLRGPRGNGKHAFATRWANALACGAGEAEDMPCGACRGCRLFRAGTHPDVRIIASPPEGKTIGVDEIRALIDYVWLSRQMARRKVVMIPAAEEMTVAAANTLLKTLEEPPGQVVFLLISHRSDRLPITIRSRCQSLDFPTPPADLVFPWLMERLPPAAGPEAERLLEAAGGAPLLAADYWENDVFREQVRFDEELTALLTGGADPLATATRWKETGRIMALEWSIGYLSRLIRLRFVMGEDGTLAGRDGRHRTDAMEELARTLDLRDGYRILDRCLETRRLLEDSASLNEQLLLEGLALDFARGG